MVLEFQWGPDGGQQDALEQKRRALLQRSQLRVQEIKAKGAKTRHETQAPRKTRETSSKAKSADPRSKGGQSVSKAAEKKVQLPPAGILATIPQNILSKLTA